MDPDRRTARVAGVLFIVATVASILGSLALGSVLEGSAYLRAVAAHDGRVTVSVVLFLMAAVSAFGTAFVLFPVLRRHAEGLAAGYVGLRIFENVLYVASAIALLMMVTVGQSDAAVGSGAREVSLAGVLLLALHDWSSLIGTILFAGMGSVVLNSVLYRSLLVPRWLSLWGVLGAALLVLYGVLGILGLDVGMSSPSTLLAMPIALQEMVLAVWLIAKGFPRSGVELDRPREARARVMA
jgi:uncharacterized protein DUF4386